MAVAETHLDARNPTVRPGTEIKKLPPEATISAGTASAAPLVPFQRMLLRLRSPDPTSRPALQDAFAARSFVRFTPRAADSSSMASER